MDYLNKYRNHDEYKGTPGSISSEFLDELNKPKLSSKLMQCINMTFNTNIDKNSEIMKDEKGWHVKGKFYNADFINSINVEETGITSISGTVSKKQLYDMCVKDFMDEYDLTSSMGSEGVTVDKKDRFRTFIKVPGPLASAMLFLDGCKGNKGAGEYRSLLIMWARFVLYNEYSGVFDTILKMRRELIESKVEEYSRYSVGNTSQWDYVLLLRSIQFNKDASLQIYIDPKTQKFIRKFTDALQCRKRDVIIGLVSLGLSKFPNNIIKTIMKGQYEIFDEFTNIVTHSLL